MFRRLLSALCFALLVVLSRAAEADEVEGQTAWVLGSAGFGFGGGHLGAMYASASGEAHVWLLDDIGIGARYAALATGAPDGGGAEGNAITGLVSYRHAFGEIEHTPHTQKWFFASVGVGATHLSGYEGRMRGRDDFDQRSPIVTARLAMLMSWRFLAFGGAVEATVVPGQGGAGSMSMIAGAIF
ncbi:MAG: hypothetical protein ACXVEF_14365 [Polyangiales bacterium]